MPHNVSTGTPKEGLGEQVLAWALGLGLALGFVLWLAWETGVLGDSTGSSSPPRVVQQRQPLPPPAPTPPAGSISAIQLYREASGNTFAAQEKYAGKNIQVWGVVQRVAADAQGRPTVYLKGNVACACYSGTGRRLSKLHPGDFIQTGGTYAGFDYGVKLVECHPFKMR